MCVRVRDSVSVLAELLGSLVCVGVGVCVYICVCMCVRESVCVGSTLGQPDVWMWECGCGCG